MVLPIMQANFIQVKDRKEGVILSAQYGFANN